MRSHVEQLEYVRVSTSKQTTDQQYDALKAAGITRIFEDVMSGAKKNRAGLQGLLDYARAGDTITVVAPDRLGRSMTHVILTIEELQERASFLSPCARESTSLSPWARCLPASSRPWLSTSVG